MEKKHPKDGSYVTKKMVQDKVSFSTKDLEKKVYFFFDEFTNYLDVEIGKRAIMLLDRLGYHVIEVAHQPSGRAFLSKGFLKEAKMLAEQNVGLFSELVDAETPLIGVEPSAILTFRDEYIDLLRDEHQTKAKKLATHVFMIEEFLASELDNGTLRPEDFNQKRRKVMLHGHCHQKALSSMNPAMKLLKTNEKAEVQLIPSGCCGMAGSFGFEKEHFDLSMKIGELVLFPWIRKSKKETIILASGTSCRHQILDGTGKQARHLVEIL
jgi:Fe-S oxidoreductase